MLTCSSPRNKKTRVMEECGNGKSVDGSVSFEKGYRCQADRVVIDQSQGLLLVTGHYGVCKPS